MSATVGDKDTLQHIYILPKTNTSSLFATAMPLCLLTNICFYLFIYFLLFETLSETLDDLTFVGERESGFHYTPPFTPLYLYVNACVCVYIIRAVLLFVLSFLGRCKSA